MYASNSLPDWIESLGYLGAFLGAILEGEVVYLSVLQAARLGYLSVPMVAAAVFLGTLVTDWGYFFLGRWQGPHLVNRYPGMAEKMLRIRDLFERRGAWLLLFYRYMYGFRIVLPILFGLSAIPVARFLLVSFFSVVIWTLLFGFLGFYLASWVLAQMDHLAQLPLWIIPLVGIGFLLFWLLRRN